MKTIYRGSFKPVGEEVTISCQIDDMLAQPDGSKPLTLAFGPEPCIIERMADNVFTPLVTTQCVLEVWSDVDYQFLDIATSPERQYRLTVSRDSAPIFVGRIVSDLYEEEYSAPPYLVHITATDGLAALKDYKPNLDELPAIEGAPTRVSLYDAVVSCLALAEPLPCNFFCLTSVNRWGSEHSYHDAFFRELQIDKGCIVNISAYEIIERMLTALSCRVFQYNANWYVERIPDRLHRPLNSMVLEDDQEMVESAELTVEAPVGRVTLKLNTENMPSLITGHIGHAQTTQDLMQALSNPGIWYTSSARSSDFNATDKGITINSHIAPRLACCTPTMTIGQGQSFNLSLRIRATHLTTAERSNPPLTDKTIVMPIYITFFVGNEPKFFKMWGKYFGFILKYIGFDQPLLQPVNQDYQEAYNADASLHEAFCAEIIQAENLIAGDWQTISISVKFPEEMVGITTKALIEIDTSMLRQTSEREKGLVTNRKSIRPDQIYNNRYVKWRTLDIEDVTVSVNIDEDKQINQLSANLNNGYIRAGDDITCTLRSNSNQMPITIQNNGAIWSVQNLLPGIWAYTSKDTAQLLSIEEHLLRVYMAQMSQTRASLNCSVNVPNAIDPRTVVSNSYLPGRLFCIVADRYNIYESQHELTLTETTDNTINTKWQLN